MTREKWKCPHTSCQQECGRRWNLSRHIRARHSGIGNPVKSSVGGSPVTKMQSNYTEFQLPGITQLTTSTFGAENDMLDSIYKTFKKARDIHDKITEIKDFYSNSTILPCGRRLYFDSTIELHRMITEYISQDIFNWVSDLSRSESHISK